MLRVNAGFLRIVISASAGVGVLVMPASVRADPSFDQLKRSYDEAVEQLRVAQDRKNELARENEQLKARLESLERRLTESAATPTQAFLQSHYDAWQAFIARYPSLKERFNSFLREGVPNARRLPVWHDPQWPFSAASNQ